ncbi:hypothetical protein ACGIF2_02890 [Cellulomonas sp. P22]|uniref:hypothetical protein n=1 Tax=Cellulomonas sp. P22 TaxID=3373189 RepID=UPI0037927D4C
MRPEVTAAVLRSSRLAPIVVSAVAGLLVVAALVSARYGLGTVDATTALHVSMLVTLVGACYVLDDPAAASLVAMPVGPLRTTTLRMIVGAVVVGTSWLAQLALAPRLVASSAEWHPLGLVVEPFAILTAVFAAGAWSIGNRPERSVVPVALLVLFAYYAVMLFVPDSFVLVASAADQAWDSSRVRWVVLLVAGLVSDWWLLRRL